MTRNQRIFVFLVVLPLLVSVCSSATPKAPPPPPKQNQLMWHFYKVTNTCRDAEPYIRHQVELLWHQDKSITPKLLRLLYSDCFVTVRKPSALFGSFLHLLIYLYVHIYSTSHHNRSSLLGQAVDCSTQPRTDA